MLDSLLTRFAACAETPFLGLWPWYHYLNAAGQLNSACEVTKFTLLGSNSSFLLILLAIVDDLLRIAGIVAVGYVIYAGIRYITSQGSPDETSKAQATLVNALIGLVIAMVAVVLVSFVGSRIGGGPGASVGGAAAIDPSTLPHTTADDNTVKNALSIVFGIVGALSLLFVTIGGFRYIISQGDPQSISKAKNTIIYALVGLVVAIAAEAIVSFVIGKTG